MKKKIITRVILNINDENKNKIVVIDFNFKLIKIMIRDYFKNIANINQISNERQRLTNENLVDLLFFYIYFNNSNNETNFSQNIQTHAFLSTLDRIFVKKRENKNTREKYFEFV